VHHVYRAGTATRIGHPVDDFESERIERVPLAGVPDLVTRGEIASGTTIAALLYTLATEQR
jgi:hypothetical protein